MSDLTEEFFNNTLDPSEEYYIKLDNGAVVTDNAYVDGNEVVFMNHKKHEIEKVLTLVPSYLELKRLESDRLAKNEGVEIVAELEEENTRLKSKRDKLAYDLGVADTKNGELLRLLKEWVEAYPVVAVTCDLKNFAKIKELLDKTNEVLK